MPGTMITRSRWKSAAACITAAILLLQGQMALGTDQDSTKQAAPGATIRDCEVCPELVVVPAGDFRMGDLSGGGDVDEGPVRMVSIPRPFAVARYETTFAQWDACAAAGACRQGVGDIGFGRGDRPVMLVTWKDAQAYAGWLSEMTGKAVPAAERGRMGVRGAGGKRDTVPVGRRRRPGQRELRRMREPLGRQAHRARRIAPRQRVRRSRDGGKRLRVGPGLRAVQL